MTWTLSPDCCFAPEASQRTLARQLYGSVEALPIVSPHGHVNPKLLADPDASFGTPAELFIIPDHYVTRMLYSQGVPLERLGVPSQDGSSVESDHRRIWQLFAENFALFRGTPSGLWLSDSLNNVFGIDEKPSAENAQRLYDRLEETLARPEYKPRALFEQFKIEVLCTTDSATDSLAEHQSLHDEGWGGRVRPTFRPDALLKLSTPGWREQLELLSERADMALPDYKAFIGALEQRRSFFKGLGATATDHGVLTPELSRLSEAEAARLFEQAQKGTLSGTDASRFSSHMLMEMARMSHDDGLVMQLHVGSFRNHNRTLYERFGADVGADIPVKTEWTRSLHEVLNSYGNAPSFRMILFTLDESSYSRELAPLAGHYPALRLGPPWWFFDSVKGMERYLDSVIETAGLYNTAGFNDDTRAFASIPARHDVWRRVTCNWLAGEVVRGLVDEADAHSMAHDFAYGLAKRAYRLGEAA